MSRPLALVRPPSAAYLRCLRSDPSIPIDPADAARQHERYREALASFADVEALAADPDLPDACFIEDTAVAAGGRVVITRPGAASRRLETASVEAALSVRRPCARIERGTLDGGDVLVSGGTAFVGLSSRTDEAGAAELGRLSGLEVRLILVGAGLHLKSTASPLGPRAVIQGKGAYPQGAFGDLEVVETDELRGANVVAWGEHVVVSAAAPRTAAMLAARGWNVHRVELSEFHAGDGAVTCLSLILA